MRYSQMDAEQRRKLDDPETFPLRVRFLGKTGTLSFLEVQFLREKGIDFEVGTPEGPPSLLRGLINALASIFGVALLARSARKSGEGETGSKT